MCGLWTLSCDSTHTVIKTLKWLTQFLPRFQSAYRASHSTETALFRVLNDLLTASDDGQVFLLTLLDISAAFDTTDHDILFHRLEHVFGIQNSALSFF